MIVKYQIFKEKHLLVARYEGNFCLKRYKEHVLKVVDAPDWDLVNKILIDLRLLEVQFKIDDIKTLVDIKKNIIKKEHISVQLVDKPMITALSHLLQEEFKNLDLTTEYCSTIKKAIELININFKENELIEILDNLENTF
jgi:hypothetical protein